MTPPKLEQLLAPEERGSTTNAPGIRAGMTGEQNVPDRRAICWAGEELAM
jgi:hypothetical protein